MLNGTCHTCPQAEFSTSARKNELQEGEPGGAHSAAVEDRAGAGASSQGSAMRGNLRASGMMQGQACFPTHRVPWLAVLIHPSRPCELAASLASDAHCSPCQACVCKCLG